jgi:precorrin isomerase
MRQLHVDGEYQGVHISEISEGALNHSIGELEISEGQYDLLRKIAHTAADKGILSIQGIEVNSGNRWIKVGNREIEISTDSQSFGTVVSEKSTNSHIE